MREDLNKHGAFSIATGNNFHLMLLGALNLMKVIYLAYKICIHQKSFRGVPGIFKIAALGEGVREERTKAAGLPNWRTYQGHLGT